MNRIYTKRALSVKIFLLGAVAGALVLLLTCLLAFGERLQDAKVSQEAAKTTREYIYSQLQTVSPALERFLETNDISNLELAWHNLAKLSAACVAWGDNFPYLCSEETGMTDINAAWCVRFFVCTHEHISEMLLREITPDDRQLIADFVDVFSCPADGDMVTFTSVFMAFAKSDLFNRREFNYLITYGADQQLIPAKF